MAQGRLPFLSGQLEGECAGTTRPHRHKEELNVAKCTDSACSEDDRLGQYSVIVITCKRFCYLEREHFIMYCCTSTFTANLLIELEKYFFTLKGVAVFLSERLCQDPLEKFFGCQWQRGGMHENPNIQQFLKNTQTLCVVNSCCRDIVKRKFNCRGNKDMVKLGQENKPLPKCEQARDQWLLRAHTPYYD